MSTTNTKTLTKITDFEPLRGKIFVTDLEEGMRMTRGGIIRLDDNMQEAGIRPRWAKVWRTASDIDEVVPGEWVLIEHGRWTLRIPLEIENERIDVWMIEPKAILLVSDTLPQDTTRHHL